MDDDGDDDFGNLYADIEVEASSAMDVASQLKCVIDETANQNRDLIAAIDDVENGEDNDDDYDEDDDDDLEIVLNSDDDSVRHVEGFTIPRNNSNLGNRELDEDDANWGTEQSLGMKVVSHSMYKYLRPQSAAHGSDLKGSGCVTAAYVSREDLGYCQRIGATSVRPQSLQFSLPWSRNILDVNIDIFEQKPWKHPGADITDYFNFGFNEDSWKLYCNQVNEYRHRGPMYSDTPLIEPAHLTERKGRPIQVEDSIVERQSSMDVRSQLYRDSDVIQITILDPGEHLDSCVPEASKVEDLTGDDVIDHLSFSAPSEDESVEGDHVEMDIYAHKRSSSSKPVRRGSENHENHLISDCSGETDDAIRNSNNTKESMLVAESSDAEKGYVNHCTRKHGENRYHPMHTSSVYNNRNHRDSKHKHLDDNDESHSRKLGDHRYHSRSNSPVYNNRTSRYFKPNPCHENETSKPHEHRYYARQSKAHHEYDDSFPMSDIEGTYDVHSSFGCSRRNERLHAFDPNNEEKKTYLKSELPSNYYGERFSGYDDRDTLARDLHHEGYERYGAKMDRSDFRCSKEKEYYGDRRRYTEDNRMMEGDWGLNERELAVENVDSGWKNSKYPPYLKYKRGAPWKRKGVVLHFRSNGGDGEFYRERKFSDDILGEKYETRSCNGRERDDIEYGYIKHVEYSKWEFRGHGRNKRDSSPSSELNSHLLKKEEDRVLRYREDYAFGTRSSEESHVINGRWHGNMMPRNSLDGRYGRYREHWSKRLGYDGSLGDYSEPFDREDYKLSIDGRVDMGRKRHWQSEMQWEEDEVMMRHEDAKFCADRTSLPFEKASIHKRFVSEHEPDHVDEWIDDPHVEGCKFKPRRKGTSSDKYERTSDFTRGGSHKWSFMGGVDVPDSRVVDGYDHVEELTDDPHAKGCIRYKQAKKIFPGNKCSETYRKSHERISLSCKNSFPSKLVVGEVKTEKPETMDFNSCRTDKAAKSVQTNAHEGSDIEKGQILTEEIKNVPIKVEPTTLVNDVTKPGNQLEKTGLHNPRILEAMAKMEKRRARFNEPISTAKKDSNSTGKITVMDSGQETASNKQQRPARKRRWGGVS